MLIIVNTSNSSSSLSSEQSVSSLTGDINTTETSQDIQKETNENYWSNSVSSILKTEINPGHFNSNGIFSNKRELISHNRNTASNTPLLVHNHILKSLKTIYNNIMNILELSITQRDSLNFEYPNFGNELRSILLSKNKSRLIKEDSFLCNIQRLVFAWMIYMR